MAHPYKQLPARNFWKKTVAPVPWHEVFDGERAKFQIAASDLVSSGGSCFAQRIARHLKARGFGYTSFERAHPLVDEALALKLGYDTYSARYGNLYTTRQLKQLVHQAFGLCEPIFEIQAARSGKFVDLLRPGINDGGFASRPEAVADRVFHLACVRDMFLRSDVFIFTLGLTETWVNAAGDVYYGVHPGVATESDAGADARPVNLDYIDCYNDLVETINFLRSRNPRLKFIFTVSPVALAATHQDRHVLAATVYSKSVLRSVVGKVTDQCAFADYLPSYEIFNCAQSFGQYLSEDLRDVSPRGVATAMKLFEKMFFPADQAIPAAASVEPLAPVAPQRVANASNEVALNVECEEMLNAVFK